MAVIDVFLTLCIFTSMRLNNRIRLRLSEEDYKRLLELSGEYKMKPTEFIRQAVMDGVSGLENSVKLKLISEIKREIRKIGVNINQIARWANTYKADAESWKILTMLNEVDAKISDILRRLEDDCKLVEARDR